MKTTVKIDGTVHEVESLGLGGAVAFERHFGIPASVLDPNDPTPNRAEWTAFIIWRSLRKSGVFTVDTSFDAAIDVLDGAEVDQVLEPGDDGYEGADEVDPTYAPPAEPVAS